MEAARSDQKLWITVVAEAKGEADKNGFSKRLEGLCWTNCGSNKMKESMERRLQGTTTGYG